MEFPLKEGIYLDTYTVAFFGHRYVEDFFRTEDKLQKVISERFFWKRNTLFFWWAETEILIKWFHLPSYGVSVASGMTIHP